MPPIVEAYIAYLQLEPDGQPTEHLDLQSAICVLLYTLCKVRGYKVIVGFLNNEPRYLEPILDKLEEVLAAGQDSESEWQVPYVLLLWLSHLLLTPFDLASISDTPAFKDGLELPNLKYDLPPIAVRILRVGFDFLPSPTKAQDAASTLLLRLNSRPDMQKLRVADAVVAECLLSLHDQSADVPVNIYERLGPLRLLSGIATSAELGHLIPSIYRACQKLSSDDASPVASNAVAKKIMVKTLRNIAILSMRSANAQGPLLSFFETTGILEDVIDHLLRSLGDRDTPVRYAAAKALSRIILELEPAMGHEVVQAILDTFKEDMPRHSEVLDFSTANALKWHGLTLALAHTLFKRSASPEQLPDIVNALVSALQFEQRTATGSSVGTNVRDAANFGIWSLSRRFTTNELLSVDASTVLLLESSSGDQSVIQGLAIQLILSACLDPVGNIRRGSSAALQELIGRHPNRVRDGISLVQTVEYQAVGLRRRAMDDVSFRAAQLEAVYWSALVNGLLGWRGVGSSDVSSREAAAAALSKFSTSKFDSSSLLLRKVKGQLLHTSSNDVENLHGMVLSLAYLVDELNKSAGTNDVINGDRKGLQDVAMWDVLSILQISTKDVSPRLIRSELPSAMAWLLGALCRMQLAFNIEQLPSTSVPLDKLDELTERLLAHREETIQQAVPSLVRSLFALKRKSETPFGCIGAQNLSKQVAIEGSRSTRNGACRVIALGALAFSYDAGTQGGKAATALKTLADLTSVMSVDRRIVGVKAIQLAVEAFKSSEFIEQRIAETIINAVHRSLNDYTIDERGDIGSLVRLQAVSCTSSILASDAFRQEFGPMQVLQADMYRLSLEKLDRVRLEAAQCRHQYLDLSTETPDVASVSSYQYFQENLRPLIADEASWKRSALIEGCISCAGISAEPLLQASRAALFSTIVDTTPEALVNLMSIFAGTLKSLFLEGANTHPALELLAFFLDMQIPQRIAETEFKWRNLLSTVQKSHHKSNDIPKILAAVHVYRGLADIPTIHDEVLKKLISMLKTNPYPRIRSSVAEALFVVTEESMLKDRDWMKPASQHLDVVGRLQEQYVKG